MAHDSSQVTMPKDQRYRKRGKAAAARHLASYTLEVARIFPTGSPDDERNVPLMKKLVNFYNIMDDQGHFLPEEVAEECAQVGQDISNILSALSAEAHGNHEKAWQFGPKVHLIEHMTGDLLLTPRYRITT